MSGDYPVGYLVAVADQGFADGGAFDKRVGQGLFEHLGVFGGHGGQDSTDGALDAVVVAGVVFVDVVE